MSEQEQAASVECKICGRDGFPAEDCEQCHGRAGVQPKNYTLSELRSMSAEERRKTLYSDRPSGSAPTAVKLPGTA